MMQPQKTDDTRTHGNGKRMCLRGGIWMDRTYLDRAGFRAVERGLPDGRSKYVDRGI